MGSKTRLRYEAVKVADLTDDQKTAAAILTALAASVTQEDLQEFFLSQVKRIIHGDNPGNWYDNFVASGILSLQDLTGLVVGRVWNVELLGLKDGINRAFTTPADFLPNTQSIWHNGRKLHPALDYLISESGGPGTGYDTVTMVSLIPVSHSLLTADYTAT